MASHHIQHAASHVGGELADAWGQLRSVYLDVMEESGHGAMVGTIPPSQFSPFLPDFSTQVTKGSVSYLSSPCFSTIIGGIGGPARGKRRLLDVMY